ncbi:hypothetical protein B0T25DRAFT_121013 [Lasiosphaeria hispida]|uniref:Uncharacterized protein n=1 Tax=Lasiosphaeria hispida TaxID=260671 RepID=A0AAJ0HRR4_9PEZI|nr:hypothetical protein B0T25DRAFT_121013 [Lasiosphaeria hispida]
MTVATRRPHLQRSGRRLARAGNGLPASRVVEHSQTTKSTTQETNGWETKRLPHDGTIQAQQMSYTTNHTNSNTLWPLYNRPGNNFFYVSAALPAKTISLTPRHEIASAATSQSGNSKRSRLIPPELHALTQHLAQRRATTRAATKAQPGFLVWKRGWPAAPSAQHATVGGRAAAAAVHRRKTQTYLCRCDEKLKTYDFNLVSYSKRKHLIAARNVVISRQSYTKQPQRAPNKPTAVFTPLNHNLIRKACRFIRLTTPLLTNSNLATCFI